MIETIVPIGGGRSISGLGEFGVNDRTPPITIAPTIAIDPPLDESLRCVLVYADTWGWLRVSKGISRAAREGNPSCTFNLTSPPLQP